MRHLLLGFALGHRAFGGCTTGAVTEAGTGAGGSHERRRLRLAHGRRFRQVPGLMSTASGYTGSAVAILHYEQALADGTGHTEPKGEG